ncbi:MAG: hypothetical protein H7X95_02505, partial [Deltaproteobacteria bacterium]|nr:hypothetical protein [Deltaproteobacteria bacterium]
TPAATTADTPTPSAVPVEATPPGAGPSVAPPPPVIRPPVDTVQPIAPRHGVRGFALELSTTGFASGALEGGLGAGFSTGSVVLGLRLAHAWQGVRFDTTETEQTRSELAIGPFVRFRLIRALDGRAELIGAVDASFVRASTNFSAPGFPEEALTASGLGLAIGPGIRLWIDPHIAIGYTSQWTYSSISGSQAVISGASGTADVDITVAATGFAGRFQILAIF